MVCVPVCLPVCVLVTRVCCAKVAKPIEMPFGCCLTCVQCIRWGQDPSMGGGNYGDFRHIQSIGSLCCGACSKRDNSILNSGMTARLLQPTAMLPTGRCHLHCPHEKSAPSFDTAFRQRILWPLVITVMITLSSSLSSSSFSIKEDKKTTVTSG